MKLGLAELHVILLLALYVLGSQRISLGCCDTQSRLQTPQHAEAHATLTCT